MAKMPILVNASTIGPVSELVSLTVPAPERISLPGTANRHCMCALRPLARLPSLHAHCDKLFGRNQAPSRDPACDTSAQQAKQLVLVSAFTCSPSHTASPALLPTWSKAESLLKHRQGSRSWNCECARNRLRGR